MNIFKQIKLTFRLIKVERFIGSLVYSLQRDRLEREFEQSKSYEPSIEPGKLNEVKPTERGASFYFERAELDVCFLSAELVRIDWKPGKLPVPYGIARQDWQEVEITLDETAEGWVVASSALQILIKTDGSLKLQTAAGVVLREELPPQRQGEAWQHQGKLRTEEHIYGLGEKAAPLNLRAWRDKAYRMWNYDAGGRYGPGTDPIYLCIPVYLGLHQEGSYLIFYENTFSATFSFDEVATASFEGGSLRYYLILNPVAIPP